MDDAQIKEMAPVPYRERLGLAASRSTRSGDIQSRSSGTIQNGL
jgi:hypothetical protein